LLDVCHLIIIIAADIDGDECNEEQVKEDAVNALLLLLKEKAERERFFGDVQEPFISDDAHKRPRRDGLLEAPCSVRWEFRLLLLKCNPVTTLLLPCLSSWLALSRVLNQSRNDLI
jgi:hypothetical protein